MKVAPTMVRRMAGFAAVLAAVSGGLSPCHAGVGCVYEWDTQFASPAVYTGQLTRAAEVFDDGTGAQLYVGGSFTSFGGALARSLVRFDGTRWTGLGQFNTRSGPGGNVISAGEIRDIMPWDHDNTPATPDVLVVCGSFNRVVNPSGTNLDTHNIAYWNGTAWTRLGTINTTSGGFTVTGGLTDGDFAGSGGGLTGGWVDSLAVYPIGGVPRLVAAGNFKIKSSTFRNIAYWNGTAWTSVGSADLGFQKFVDDVIVHDDGTGPQLYIGGRFANVSITGTGAIADTTNIARFDGTTWSAVGAGTALDVNELLSFDADGPGGNPATLFLQSVGAISTWNGSAYTPQTITGLSENTYSRGLSVFNAGDGPGVYVGSWLNDGGTGTIFTKWDGVGNFAAASSALYLDTVSGITPLMETAAFDLGAGPRLLALGMPINNTPFGHLGIFAWSGSAFSNLPEPTPGGFGTFAPDIESMVAFDPDGAGAQTPGLYIAGFFETAGGTPIDSFVRFDDNGYTPVAGRINDQRVHRLAVGDVGGVTSLFGAADNHVARLDGSNWTILGPDAFDFAPNALATADVGGGSMLYAAGAFTINGAQGVAQWNGAAWEPVGTGILTVDTVARTIAVVSESGQDTLWVTGIATSPEGQIAKWDGTAWTDVSAGLPASFFPSIHKVGDDLLAVAGSNNLEIYRWDGTQWTPHASQPAGIGTSRPIGIADRGDGPRLYAYGQTSANEFNRHRTRLFVLEGTQWTDLSLTDQGQFTIGVPKAIARYDLDGQASFFFGGSFVGAGGTSVYTANSSRGIARWFCPAQPCPADFNGDNTRDVADLFAYINAWLVKTPNADFNGDTAVDVADLFAYINAWLAGC